ncbi:MAG: DUF6763 family protein [Sulfuricaulis sp.]
MVGVFYEDEDGRTFEVVSFDENDGTIEVQYADNTTDEIDLDDWYGLDLERLESDEEDDDDAVDKVDESVVADDDDDLDDDLEVEDEE